MITFGEVDHLHWIYKRLIHKYGENPNTDFMLEFYRIIRDLKRQAEI